MHTVYCDGKNTPEQMVLSAIEKGLKTVGICAHAPMPFYADWCVKMEKINAFIKEVNALKEKYKDKITVLCGLEDDYFAVKTDGEFDYVIGSVHFFKVGEKYYSIDLSADALRLAVEEGFGGDAIAAARQYFSFVVEEVKKGVDVIGHFDLITKFNEVENLFDTNDPEYIKIWKDALDKLISLGKPFEVNTGAISRGYRTSPYPAFDMIEYIKANGGKLILSSDSHNADNIAFQFTTWQKLL